MTHTKSFLVTCCLLLFAATAVRSQEPPVDVGFEAEAIFSNASEIRRSAAVVLRSHPAEAAPKLIESLQTRGPKHASIAAAILVSLGKDENKNSAAAPFAPQLVELLANEKLDARNWYLAANVLDKVHPKSKKDALPSILAALRQPPDAKQYAMKQYAALQMLYYMKLGSDDAEEVRTALFDLLHRQPRVTFKGVYMEYDGTLQADNLAYTDEICVYDLDPNKHVYFIREDLFILATLKRLGANPAELIEPLTELAQHRDEYIRLEAAIQLGELEAEAKVVAVETLSALLNNPYSPSQLRIRAASALDTINTSPPATDPPAPIPPPENQNQGS
jgi:HEAT repeat protein